MYNIPPELLKVASPGQLEEYERLLRAEKARLSPLEYALYTNPKAKRYRHTEYLNEVLLALTQNRLYKSGPGPESVVVGITEDEPQGRRVHPVTGEPAVSQLMISLPPRIGKSWMMYHFCAWFLTTHPDDTIMYITHSAHLAEFFTPLAMQLAREHPELGIEIDPSRQSRSEWAVAGKTGGMIARGSGGVPTGRGGNLVIDDPFKDGEEAMSDSRREKVHEHYNSSLRTRVEPGCWKILVGTRWHENDLHGYLLNKEEDQWFVVNIPALAFDSVDEDGISVDPETLKRDVFNRLPGQPVCPEIAPKSYYEEARVTSPFWFDAEYQGKPSGLTGRFFGAFPKYRRLVNDRNESTYEIALPDGTMEYISERNCVRFATADFALKEKETSDWTVFAVWDIDHKRRLFLRHVEREHVPADEPEEWFTTQYNRWGVRVAFVEEANHDHRWIQKMLLDGKLAIWPCKPDKSKTVRAIPSAQLVRRGMLLVDRDAEWLAAYESELKQFDRGEHDDQVDVTSYASLARDMLKENPPPKRPEDDDYTTYRQWRIDEALKKTTKDKPNADVLSAP